MKEIKEKINYCLNCKIKPCRNKGCPLGNDIPGFIQAMKEEYREVKYNIKTQSPQIEVTDCKAKKYSGYIKGKVTNNTDTHFPSKNIQIHLYNSKGTYLGSEIKEIKYFNVTETINFEFNYNYNDVTRVDIEIVDALQQNQQTQQNEGTEETVKQISKEENDFDRIKLIENQEIMKIAVPIATALAGNYILTIIAL